MSSQDLTCIVRIDVDKPKQQHCWEVKIIRRGNSFHRSFSDSKFGGKMPALGAAMRCRDKELKKRPAMNAFEQAIRPKKTNKSGIVGVRKTRRLVRRGEKSWSYDVWAVTGTPESGGKTKTRYFSIDGMGERNAKAAAITLRQQWVRLPRFSGHRHPR
ncbi:MAG: hypothetical protein Q8N18_13220 [Opitutaceae bacterium]|nr:hypothetical protein [Opitutaceae bacterium]